MRRKPRAHSLGLGDLAPPTKKRRMASNHGQGSITELDPETYSRHIKQLEREGAKSVKNRAAVRALMRDIFEQKKVGNN